MIRERAPIVLIPAAWALTGYTVLTEASPYWIRGMNLFITAFLAVFAASSWRKMSSGVLRIWRTVIAAGAAATAIGTLQFYGFNRFAWVSVTYWFMMPGVALIMTSEQTEKEIYRWQGYTSIAAYAPFAAGILRGNEALTALGILLVAASQAWSMYTTSKIDGFNLKTV